MTVLVLASGSARRRELLGRFGLTFDVWPADVDESPLPDEEAADLVRRLAVAKAVAAIAAAPESDVAVLAADTVVDLDGQILAKPVDATEAATMLRTLSGRTHQVLTAVAVAARRDGPAEVGRTAAGAKDQDRTDVQLGPATSLFLDVVATEVTFVDLSDADIEWYVTTGEPLDKAGAYGIQGLGAVFVSSIQGSHDNVVGLPLVATRRLLAEVGIDLRDR